MGDSGKVMLMPRGDYSPATPYEELDCVYFNGRSYVCKQESTGNLPTNTTYWQPMTPDASAEIQALTNYVGDNNVKNVFDFKKYDVYNGTVSINGDAMRITATNKVNANAYYTINNLKKNTDYIISMSIDYTSGVSGVYVGGSTTTSNFTTLIDRDYTADANVSFTFNTGNYNYFRISLFATHGATAMDGDTTFSEIMIRDASITDPTYQPYAKTNVELTEKLTGEIITVSNYSASEANAWEYSNISFTLEKPALVDVFYNYNNSPAKGVAISLSNNSLASSKIVNEVTSGSAIQAIGILPAGTYYVLVKAGGTGSNQIRVYNLMTLDFIPFPY